MRAGFVIPANEECEVGCDAGAAVVFVEIADSPVFVGYGHAVEIIAVADCLGLLDRYRSQPGGKADLEVAPNDEQANCPPVVDFTSLLDGGVDRVESAMTLSPCELGTLICGMKSYTTLDGNAHVVECTKGLAVSLYDNAAKDVEH